MCLTTTLHILCKFYISWLIVCFISLFLPIVGVVETRFKISSSRGQAHWHPQAASPMTGLPHKWKDKGEDGKRGLVLFLGVIKD
jgi:hypothetical protein